MATSRTAPRSKSSVPAGKVDFDLDALEIQVDAPVVVKMKGAKVRLRNVKDLDWQVAATLRTENLFAFFEEIVLEDDQEAFLLLKVTAKELERVFEFYREHFDLRLGGPGESRA